MQWASKKKAELEEPRPARHLGKPQPSSKTDRDRAAAVPLYSLLQLVVQPTCLRKKRRMHHLHALQGIQHLQKGAPKPQALGSPRQPPGDSHYRRPKGDAFCKKQEESSSSGGGEALGEHSSGHECRLLPPASMEECARFASKHTRKRRQVGQMEQQAGCLSRGQQPRDLRTSPENANPKLLRDCPRREGRGDGHDICTQKKKKSASAAPLQRCLRK